MPFMGGGLLLQRPCSAGDCLFAGLLYNKVEDLQSHKLDPTGYTAKLIFGKCVVKPSVPQ